MNSIIHILVKFKDLILGVIFHKWTVYEANNIDLKRGFKGHTEIALYETCYSPKILLCNICI